MAEELMLKVEDVYKKYRLGLIGGGTLVGDLQSWWAKVRHKEDPNSQIGAKVYEKNETFYALNGISFEVKKGETLGIIGGNGAGKSTTLKLISQVTAPTSGKIYLNGRITSMLEVGTGFHPELTGRENIYLNGAILGMTKTEIDAKIEAIIDFSECRQFIDTPVKRYSSGMYVKLAFSVAAHLDSEIMIMDEVLAVGDINFQHKCLNKMKDIAANEGRTILYVSHNMNTIKTLCNRCIVLEHGKVVFDGDTDQAISIYSIKNKGNISIENNLADKKRISGLSKDIYMKRLNVVKCKNQHLMFELEIEACKTFKKVVLRMVIFDKIGNAICTSHSDIAENINKGKNIICFDINDSCIMNNYYTADLIISDFDEGIMRRHDVVQKAFNFELLDNEITPYDIKWNSNGWGNIQLENMKIVTIRRN